MQDVERRFGGLARLYGVEGAARIRAAHVAVVGIGGVGSWAAEALARSGVGQLTLIDLDHVAESNINRQIHALTDTVGQAKVLAMRDRVAQIHPACAVHCVDDFATPENWPALLPHAVDAVIDACDQVKAKTAIAAWARSAGMLHITVGAAGGKRHAHQVEVDDLAHTTHDPLLAQLRYNLRKHHRAPRDGKKIGVTCVFSRESVAGPDASCNVDGDGSLNCHGYGSVVAVTATFGQCAAGWVLDRLTAAKS
ncbi:MAG: tRNA threonylcarbamoyladenosine dehydratase [Acidovorax sp.]|uniref:tRNA threonylcarbamoyladenosine dehydratase n=1 Tax=Acidovorax sp. TaxID=1872122 RepID=UPI0039E71E45